MYFSVCTCICRAHTGRYRWTFDFLLLTAHPQTKKGVFLSWLLEDFLISLDFFPDFSWFLADFLISTGFSRPWFLISSQISVISDWFLAIAYEISGHVGPLNYCHTLYSATLWACRSDSSQSVCHGYWLSLSVEPQSRQTNTPPPDCNPNFKQFGLHCKQIINTYKCIIIHWHQQRNEFYT